MNEKEIEKMFGEIRTCETCNITLSNQASPSWIKECFGCYSYNDTDGRFVEAKRDKLLAELAQQGYYEHPHDEFIKGLNIGDRVKWIGIDGKFRIGGAVMAEHEGDEEKYFVIASYKKRAGGGTQGIFLQPDTVREIWIKKKKIKVPKAKDSKVKFKEVKDSEDTHPLVSYIGDVIVKRHMYASDKKRFESTKKFERAETYGFEFE